MLSLEFRSRCGSRWMLFPSIGTAFCVEVQTKELASSLRDSVKTLDLAGQVRHIIAADGATSEKISEVARAIARKTAAKEHSQRNRVPFFNMLLSTA